ncbi:hypothetical protein J5X84_41280 [Streptosporangiaceae bacterium NEAU-GS5]|nr:hypothetical protein [Streptosporangiaceae bacterium NEAU-GS5]
MNPELFFSRRSPYEKVFSAAFGDGHAVIGATWESDVVLSAENGRRLGRYPRPEVTVEDGFGADPRKYEIWDVVAYGDTALAMTGHERGKQNMWDIGIGEWYAIPLPGVSGRNRLVLDHPDGPFLIAGGGQQPVSVFTFAGDDHPTILNCPPGASPALRVMGRADGELALIRDENGFSAFEPTRPAALHCVATPADPLPYPTDLVPLASVFLPDREEVSVLCSVRAQGAWVLTSGGFFARVPMKLTPFHASVPMIGGVAYFAVALGDQVLLIDAADGRTHMAIPFLGPVRGLTSPGDASVCALVADELVVVEIESVPA